MYEGYEDDEVQESGITAELLVSDLRQNGSGYILEITTDGVEDKVVTEGHFLGDSVFAEIDHGQTDEINNILGTRLDSEHAVRITNKDRTEMTIYAEGNRLLSLIEGEDEVEQYDNERELIDAVEGFVR